MKNIISGNLQKKQNKCGGNTQYLRHSGSLEKYYEPANSYFRKQNFCHSEDFEKLQNLCHSEGLEKCYEFMNSYFSCYSKSVNADKKPIEMDRFRISGTRIKRISASPYILCSCLSGMTQLSRSFLSRMTEKTVINLFAYLPINLSQ